LGPARAGCRTVGEDRGRHGLQSTDRGPTDSAKVAEARAALERLVQALADRTDRDAARRLILETGKPVYEAVPARPDLVVQVWPDGRRIRGRVVEGEFVAEKRAGKKGSRFR